MTARDEVVAVLTAAMPTGIAVLPYSRDIDPPSQPTVMVRIDEVTPSSQPQALRDYGFALILVASKTTPGPADDELDALLEDVLTALDASEQITWSKATRATFNEQYPAYQVDLNTISIKEG